MMIRSDSKLPENYQTTKVTGEMQKRYFLNFQN